MILIVVREDIQTAERIGASGTFQITEISIANTDGKTVDISDLVDRDRNFDSEDELKSYLEETLHTPAAHIDLSIHGLVDD